MTLTNKDLIDYTNSKETVKNITFLNMYNTTINEVNTNCKVEFRYICFNHIDYIKNIVLPDIQFNSIYEAVLIEYRKMPHLEFLIRNAIIKLGPKWSHTIICGNLNYSYIKNMCANISPNIKVIKTNYDNLCPSEYSLMLASLNFWNLLNGHKILIYQEDSMIFKNNIEDFLHFDYIGAPWPEGQDDNKHGVGNGGISLRTKNIMVQIINTVNIKNMQFNSSTLNYMKNTKSTVGPEDVYFTKSMEDLNLGYLADRKSAMDFSTESYCNKNSFGGHNFWIKDTTWRNRVTETIIQFKPNYTTDVAFNEHRGGWAYVINNLINSNFYNKNSKVDFFDMIEHKFLFEKNYVCANKWCGIIHCTNITPPYLDCVNIDNMFSNPNFIKSLPNCLFIVSLSNYLTYYLNNKFIELHFNIKIYTLKHPVICKNIPLFDTNKYVNNTNKTIVQLGQQLRKLTSIYLLKSDYNKLWLTGTKNFKKCRQMLNDEIEWLNIDRTKMDPNVNMYYTNTFDEFDELLTKNVILIDLFDASANNSVIECIVRNTPMLINKVGGVVDYLGNDYPLYFTNLDEIPLLLNDVNIIKAHNYLLNMNKNDLSVEYFMQQLFSIVQSHIV